MNEGMPLVLASTSPRRHELMKALGLDFEVCPPGDAENDSPGEKRNPAELAQRLALGKAEAASLQHRDAAVLGADTIVCLGSRVFGKPADAAEAKEMLLALRGKPHRVITGLALITPGEKAPTLAHVSTTVLMRHFSEEEIEQYVASGDPLDKAGAYAVQNAEFHPAAPVNGCYFNVVGLPICAASEILRQVGLRPRVDLDVTSACTSHRCPFYGLASYS